MSNTGDHPRTINCIPMDLTRHLKTILIYHRHLNELEGVIISLPVLPVNAVIELCVWGVFTGVVNPSGQGVGTIVKPPACFLVNCT